MVRRVDSWCSPNAASLLRRKEVQWGEMCSLPCMHSPWLWCSVEHLLRLSLYPFVTVQQLTTRLKPSPSVLLDLEVCFFLRCQQFIALLCFGSFLRCEDCLTPIIRVNTISVQRGEAYKGVLHVNGIVWNHFILHVRSSIACFQGHQCTPGICEI